LSNKIFDEDDMVRDLSIDEDWFQKGLEIKY